MITIKCRSNLGEQLLVNELKNRKAIEYIKLNEEYKEYVKPQPATVKKSQSATNKSATVKSSSVSTLTIIGNIEQANYEFNRLTKLSGHQQELNKFLKDNDINAKELPNNQIQFTGSKDNLEIMIDQFTDEHGSTAPDHKHPVMFKAGGKAGYKKDIK